MKWRKLWRRPPAQCDYCTRPAVLVTSRPRFLERRHRACWMRDHMTAAAGAAARAANR